MPTLHTALIIFASNSGSTYQVAQNIAEIFGTKGIKTTLLKASEAKVTDIKDYEIILMGSPSWLVDHIEGSPHEYIQAFMKKCGESEFKNKKVAAFGCGDSSYLNFCHAVDTLDEFLTSKSGSRLYEPLKIDSFFFALDKNIAKTRTWAEQVSKNIVVESVSSLV